ncbi:sensor domain-containing protein [Mycobacteriaceae bacterium NPDC060252]
MRGFVVAGVSALALVFAPAAQAVGPDAVLLKPKVVNSIVGTELPVIRTVESPTAGYQVSEPSCLSFVDVGLDDVFNGNGELAEFRGQTSQKSDSDTTYSVKQAVGVLQRPIAAVDPVVALLFMDNCYGVPLDVTDGQGVRETWTITKGKSVDTTASWSMTSATGTACYVQMRAKREVLLQVKACVPKNGEKIAAALADAMEGRA